MKKQTGCANKYQRIPVECNSGFKYKKHEWSPDQTATTEVAC